jgi:hypothetical protein
VRSNRRLAACPCKQWNGQARLRPPPVGRSGWSRAGEARAPRPLRAAGGACHPTPAIEHLPSNAGVQTGVNIRGPSTSVLVETPWAGERWHADDFPPTVRRQIPIFSTTQLNRPVAPEPAPSGVRALARAWVRQTGVVGTVGRVMGRMLTTMVAVCALTGVLAPSAPAQTRRDSAAVRARLVLSISEFQAAWQRAWRETENQRYLSPNGAAQRRLRGTLVHCHPTEADSQFIRTFWHGSDDIVRQRNFQFAQVTGRNSMFAACPTWLFADPNPSAQDERFGRDAALLESMRVGMHNLRALLLTELDVAADNFPGDGWITGQRVRFLFDQNDVAGAQSAARSCKGETWWCAALRGYAHARINEVLPGRSRVSRDATSHDAATALRVG